MYYLIKSQNGEVTVNPADLSCKYIVCGEMAWGPGYEAPMSSNPAGIYPD
jgi:hypothetical protein